MNIQIIPVSDENQIDMIERLAFEIWNQHFIPIIGKAQVDYMLAKFQSKAAIADQIANGYLYYLFDNGDQHIGYMAVLPQADRLFLSKLYIVASGRGKGYGRQALAFLEKMAIEKGADRISLTVNRHNGDTISAYERLGFQNVGTVVQDIGGGFVMDDYRMEKRF
jgi:GNAT superfamily N-acetyltransferase